MTLNDKNVDYIYENVLQIVSAELVQREVIHIVKYTRRNTAPKVV